MDLISRLQMLNQDLAKSNTIILVSECEIEYWGRSRSVIGSGQRLILIKPDTTIIIHSPAGFKPVNWMSSPNDISCEIDGDHIQIFAQRTVKPFEEIKIKLTDVIDYNSYMGLKDKKKLDLTHTEMDMRDYLAEHPNKVHPDFRLKSKEYKTTVGLIDLFGRIGQTYCVVELKSQKAGLPAVLQLKRYRDWLRSELRQDIHAILMAPSIASNPDKLLKKEGMEFRKFNVRTLKIRRSESTLESWM